MRPELLSQIEIEDNLSELNYWILDEIKIKRELVFPNFVSSVGFLNSVAILAEKLNHHPDLTIYGWNKLRITITTWDRGGLTELDFKLANEIESLINN